MYTHSVSSLNEQIKSLLEESFNQVLVEGELSRITFHNSGHIYFTLKDKNSAISCVMFRGNASRLKFRLEEGLKVVINGAISLYAPRGSYQINCFSIEPSGQGALALAYEQLKQKLSQKGYFEQSRKKPLPPFVSRLALVTSATGAALQDMLRVAQNRYRVLEIDIYDTLVQGEGATYSIANAIDRADTQNYDVIVVGRGGGSIEDLWAFNEERVADAIFRAKTPIVSAVGHEIDTLISDFVADVRAPTPSAAMEMILPDTNELYITLDSLSTQYEQILNQKIAKKSLELQHIQNLFAQNSIERKLSLQLEETKRLSQQLTQQIEIKLEKSKQDIELVKSRFLPKLENILHIKSSELNALESNLVANNPKTKLKKGYAQLSKGKKVVAIEELQEEDSFELQSDNLIVKAKVLEIQR